MNMVWMLALLTMQPALGVQSKAMTEENPMRKIITMLQDMSKEVEREAAAEKEIFDKALCACENGEEELDKTIADSQAAIEEYTSKVEGGNAESAQLTQEVADHKTTAATAKKDLSEATMLRDKEHAAFLAEEKDLKTNLASMGKAIPAIEQGMSGASLMQMPGMNRKMDKFRRYVEVSKFINNDDRSAVLAFLDEGDSAGDASQSRGAGEILGILKNMKDEMEKDLGETQASEKAAHEGFNELKAAKEQEISINEKSVISKDKRIGAIAVELSESNHALEDSKEELANAQKFKANMKEQCESMATQKAQREKARADEIKAISEAVGILNDDDALEVFSKSKAAALVQKPRPTYDALIQITQKSHVVRRHKSDVMLLSVNQKTHRASEETQNPAEKLVKQMIDSMVGVLHDEDVNDEHKKAYCANETEVAHSIEAEKEESIEKTTAEISEQEDELATLVSEIKALTAKIQDLDKLVHETSETRKAEHQEFVDMFATSTTAIRLINKAIKRLEKFYSPKKYAAEKKAVEEAALAKAGMSLSQKKQQQRVNTLLVQRKEAALLPGGFDAFIQVSSQTNSMARFRSSLRDGVDPIVLPDTPQGAPEKSESGGVMALMTEFVTDLKTEMTEAETSEKFNAKEYVRIMSDAQETRAGDVKSMNQKKAAKATVATKLTENKEALALTEEELQNLKLYLVQLHTECDFLMRNFDVRHEDRVDGESGLEAAETIVTEGTPPSYREIENRYKEEKTDDDVDEHFPGTPIDDGPDKR